MNIVKFKKDSDLFNLDDAFKTFDRILTDWSGFSNKSALSPRVEITEDRDNFYINLEMPGVKKEDVKIYTENNVLYIKGVKKQSFNKEEKSLVMNERYYGEFSRSFNLTKDVKVNDITAEFNDGVLNITLPKVEEAKPVVKEIAVK
jgi:HSP20 family protein